MIRLTGDCPLVAWLCYALNGWTCQMKRKIFFCWKRKVAEIWIKSCTILYVVNIWIWLNLGSAHYSMWFTTMHVTIICNLMKENMHVVLMRIVCENLENSLYLWNKKQLLMSKLSFNFWLTVELAHSFWILDIGSICASFQDKYVHPW